jgi:hypothetical protein
MYPQFSFLYKISTDGLRQIVLILMQNMIAYSPVSDTIF